jgi:hypothetical protein
MTTKIEHIREGDVKAHGLNFHIVMVHPYTEAEFKAFCLVLEECFENNPDLASQLHKGCDGCFQIEYDDGSTDEVKYNALGGYLIIKSVTSYPQAKHSTERHQRSRTR